MLQNVLRGLPKYNNYVAITILRTKEHYGFLNQIAKMYNNSGFGGYFSGSVQGLGQIPMHSGVLNNPRVNRNYPMGNGGMNMLCPMRKVLCGELRLHDAGSQVEICGRIQNQRLGRFLSLRDETGITQLVVPDDRIDIQRRLRNMPLNSFLMLRGFVSARPDKSRNEKMATGDVEVLIENLVSVHPKRKKDDSDSDDEDFKRHKKKASVNSASFKLTSEELSKCPTPNLIRHFSQRSHTCGELSKRLVGKSITLCGWVSAKRVGRFVMLKDGYGSVQIVPGFQNTTLTNNFQNLHLDSILLVKGVVSCRPPGHENPRVENGNIEILVESLNVVNPQDPAPPGEEEGNGDGDDSGGKKKDVFIVPGGTEEKNDQKSCIPKPNKYTRRTHNCGQLNSSNVGEKVCLMGWVEFIRMDKFILLRDRYGKTQLIVPESRTDLQDLLETLTLESVVQAEGTVCCRPPGQENTKQVTGAIEVSLTDLKVLSKAASSLPFYIKEFNMPKESVRMKYRYLDLRFDFMQQNLRTRSETLHKMRRFLIEQLDFLEVETPTLFKRTPGGAQEFIVPTQTKGKFYSLVQSPQQFKQLLMVGSADRYFQIAHCYRDETCVYNRQPEFTQLDLEMSFCDRESVINLIEDLLKYCWPENLTPLETPFPRMTYEEAMNSYGTDKPDLRFDWKFKNLTNVFTEQKDKCKGKFDLEKLLNDNFAAFAFVARRGGTKFSNETKKNLVEEMKASYPSTSFIFLPVKTIESVQKTLENLFCDSVAEEIRNVTNYDTDDVLFLAIGCKEDVLKSLGKARVNFAAHLEEKKIDVIKKNVFNFAWILDFPLFEMDGEKIVSAHHPFTQAHPDYEHLLKSDPLKVKSLHYDLVLNGNEIGGGSIRIHNSETQKFVLEEILKIDSKPLSHLLDALSCGAPPHGGIALGIDRLIAILCGASSMRDVMAFPKGGMGQDPMANTPSEISDEEKALYHINTDS